MRNKQKQAKPQKQNRRKRGGRKTNPLVQHALALANPFHPNAGAHRWPDSAGIASATLQLRHFLEISAITDSGDSTHLAGVSLAPNPNAAVRRLGSSASGALSFDAGIAMPLWDNTQWKSYRVTSMGLKLHCVLADTDNGGTLFAQEGVLDPVAARSDYYARGRVSPVKSGTVAIGRPAGSGARDFVASTGAADDWAYATAVATNLGPGSGAAFMAEVIMNIEAIPNAGKITEKFATVIDKADVKAVELADSFLSMGTPSLMSLTTSFLVGAATYLFGTPVSRGAPAAPIPYRQAMYQFAPTAAMGA